MKSIKTIKSFVEMSHINENLIRGVIKQVGSWSYFKELAQDVSNAGANAGFSGFIYYTDTVKFAENNRRAIIEECKRLAADIGCEGAYSMIAGFNCLDGYTADMVIEAINDTDDDNHTEVMNALAWFALEEVSRSYVDLMEG